MAGKPRINAIKIYPSRPNDFAKGSIKLAAEDKMLISPINIFAIIHIINPAGIATNTARPKTNNVLSRMDRTMIFPTCGFLYGGNSRVKLEGIPLRNVLDSNLEIINVITTPNMIILVRINADIIDLNGPESDPTKNMAITEISMGNLPLQGTKLFVIIAINLSLGESIILHPIIPAALHPNPIHIVSACLPQALDFLKKLSRLKAILGRYPKSSSRVNNGKKIAIGGNITDTTQARVL